MIHKIFPVGPLQCNCSVIGDEKTHEAMVIDPGDQIEGILEILRQEKLTLKQIVITHAHIDHVGGAMKLKAATGAPILMNQNDYALLKMLDMQAAWIGMRPPGDVQVDEAIGQGRVLKDWRNIVKRDSYAGPHRRQHLRLFPDREKTDCRRYALCRQHRAH